MKPLWIVLVGVALVGCSGVNIYTTENLSRSTRSGVKFYLPKPYLLVARTNKKDEPISVDIVYLPDLTKPMFASQRVGIGTSTLSLKLTNGVLTEFGQTSDSKVAETVTAMTGGLKTIAEAFKIQREKELLRPQSADPAALASASARLLTVAADIDGVNAEYTRAMSTDSGIQLAAVAASLKIEAGKLAMPDAIAKLVQAMQNVEDLRERLVKLKIPAESTAFKKLGPKFDDWARTLTAIVEEFTPKPEPPPVVELYEILQDGSGTQLKRIDFPANP